MILCHLVYINITFVLWHNTSSVYLQRMNFRQILEDLCNVSKLRHVDYTKTSTEYELTPYEMLMADIRSRKYQLNKVETNSDVRKALPQTAQDVILHFIRSRPPLKPVSQRNLRPQRKESTPAEMLMESIRGSSARSSLRKTKGPPVKPLSKYKLTIVHW